MKSHVIFKDDEKDTSISEFKRVQNDASNIHLLTRPPMPPPMPTVDYSVPFHVAPQLYGYQENVPVNPENLSLDQLTALSKLPMPMMPDVVEQLQRLHAPASRMVNPFDRFLIPRRRANNFDCFSNYTSPVVSLGLNPPGVTTYNNPTYSLGLPVDNNLQSLPAQYVLRSPVYERTSPIGSRRPMPYSRVQKVDKYNEVQYTNYGQKMWDYKQQTPVVCPLNFTFKFVLSLFKVKLHD